MVFGVESADGSEVIIAGHQGRAAIPGDPGDHRVRDRNPLAFRFQFGVNPRSFEGVPDREPEEFDPDQDWKNSIQASVQFVRWSLEVDVARYPSSVRPRVLRRYCPNVATVSTSSSR